MSTFGREFKIELISDAVLEGNPWFKDMLALWIPAGDALTPDGTQNHGARLRLAIRNGYLNFYRNGQSIAKVEFKGGRELQASIHNKYVYGAKGSGQSYVQLTSAGFVDIETGQVRPYGGVEELQGWIANANDYTGKEKPFVDAVVAHNPDIIDLEMALPAFDPEDRTAPRMDLVALEPDGDRWKIVFWEAKLVGDARMRRQEAEDFPEVHNQLDQYSRWLGQPGHADCVKDAYQRTCRLLVAFHTLAQRINPAIEPLGSGIIAAARTDALPLGLDMKPRLLIYDFEGKDLAFVKNGHLEKLRGPCGIHVQMVTQPSEMKLGPF